jgi:glucose/arabinose dehydrogenase
MTRVAMLLALMLVACTSSRPDATPPTPSPTATETRSPKPTPARSDPTAPIPPLRLRRVASMDQPIAMATRAGDQTIYVAEKTGRVRDMRTGRIVLDLAGRVALGYEQGLLGLTFSPDGARIVVDYTDSAGDTRVESYAFERGRADPATKRELLFVDQPYANHNGGAIAFGPDGYLYVALGDGGSAGDPNGNAQSLDRLLGKILRMDERGRAPRDNPFVGREGARDLIWAFGLRNPWRFTFDRLTGDLWIGDVGQSSREEVDRQPASSRGGENYGWDRLEGTRPHEGSAPPNAVRPVYEYPTGEGGTCAIVGGYLYRGSIEGLRGRYLFSDNCGGRVFALTRTAAGPRVKDLGLDASGISSFGEDARGEVYVLSLNGGVYRIAPG